MYIMFPVSGFSLQVFCGLLFLGISESALKPNGANVCSRNQSYMINITRSRNVQVIKQYTTKCMPPRGWLFPRNCTKYRTVTKVQYYSDSATRYKIVYECCNGWITTGDECTIAICDKYGCKNGSCTKPDFCNCNNGYYGSSCSEECPLQKYGANCLHDCKCKNNATCDSKGGTCDCLEGWTGIYCNESCLHDTFGRNCSQKCDCEKSNLKRDCDSINGKCICRPGYIGKRCQYPCTNNTYGLACIYKCSCTPTTGICAIDTERCSCLEGYTGERCEHKCESNLTTGDSCPCNCTTHQKKCNNSSKNSSCLPCINTTHCEHRCPHANSTIGPNCQEEIGSVHSRARTIHLVLIFGSAGGSFVIIIAVALAIILRYRRRRDRSSKNMLKSGTSRAQLQQSEFCDDAPYAIPMTINNGNNMPDIHQNGVHGQQPEYENYYQNVGQLQKEDGNMNDYENVEAQKNTFSRQTSGKDDSPNTYQELCRQPYEECSHYQSLQKS